MQYFDILTILCIGLMIGAEFTVSAFINPIVWQLEETTQAKILSLFAAAARQCHAPLVCPVSHLLC